MKVHMSSQLLLTSTTIALFVFFLAHDKDRRVFKCELEAIKTCSHKKKTPSHTNIFREKKERKSRIIILFCYVVFMIFINYSLDALILQIDLVKSLMFPKKWCLV